jgi:hypothetical protein
LPPFFISYNTKSRDMRKLFCCIFILTSFNLQSQHFLNDYVNTLGQNKFYFVGQAHSNKANTLIEQQLLFSLHKTYGVRYNIMEYGHSAAFLINLYLESGDERFLSVINQDAGFGFIKAIKAYNDALPEDKRISFYGLDYEGKYTKDVLDIILQLTAIPVTDTLHKLITAAIEASDKTVRGSIFEVKKYLAANEEASRKLLGRYYVDVLLISNAIHGFILFTDRDQTMFANFKKLYAELLRTDESPRFFASFGFAHVSPDNSNGFAMRLLQQEGSPVQNSVSITGAQYLNCRFGARAYEKPSDGNLEFLCKSVAKKLTVKGEPKTQNITLLSKNDLEKLGCNKNIKYLSGVIVVKNFGAASLGAWE